MNKKLSIQDEVTEFLLYTAPGGGVKVEVILKDYFRAAMLERGIYAKTHRVDLNGDLAKPE